MQQLDRSRPVHSWRADALADSATEDRVDVFARVPLVIATTARKVTGDPGEQQCPSAMASSHE